MKTVLTGFPTTLAGYAATAPASGVTITPTAPTTGTNVQTIIDEIIALLGSGAAADVTVADAGGYFVGTQVEAALQELAAKAIGYLPHDALGAAATFDAAVGWHSGTFTANCTFTLTGALPTGTVSSLFLELAQDGTGGWTVTLPASVVNRVALEAAQDTTLSTTAFLVLLSRDGGTTWVGGWWGGSTGITVEDEGTPLATAATTLDFVGAGVTASGTGAGKTITIPGTPTGAAGGDLSGTYPNPSVVDDSHSHTSATAPAATQPPAHGHVDNVLFSGDASTTVFVLPVAPADATSIAVYVTAARSQDWTLSGALLDTLTFGSAPPAAANNIVIDITAALA